MYSFGLNASRPDAPDDQVSSVPGTTESNLESPSPDCLDVGGAKASTHVQAPVVPLPFVALQESEMSVTSEPAPVHQIDGEVPAFFEMVEQAGGAVQKAAQGRTAPQREALRRVVPERRLQGYNLLGAALVNQGWISETTLNAALQVQAETFERLGEILVRQGHLSEFQLNEALGEQAKHRNLASIFRMLGMKSNQIRGSMARIQGRDEPMQQVMRDTRYLTEEKVAIALAAMNGMQYFSEDRARRTSYAEVIAAGAAVEAFDGYLPVAIQEDGTLVVAISDLEQKGSAQNDFENFRRKKLVVASNRALHHAFCTSFAKTEEAMLKALEEAEGILGTHQEQNEENSGFARRLLGEILRHGCYAGASDIHFNPSAHVGTLNMKFDSVGRDVAFYDLDLHTRLMNLMVMDGIPGGASATGESMREGALTFEQDPKVRDEFKDIFDRYGFRLQVGKAVYGDTAVVRIVDTQGSTADLDNLPFDDESRAIVDHAIHAPDGLVLLVGPTGSGKTTTLYACLGEVDAEESSIQTIENPVEGQHGRWKQYQVAKRTNQSEGEEMGSIFKGTMRNDPDVVLVGEIRDSGVADTAVQASKTGHLVFSTLHVLNAASTISRLLGLKVDRQDVADTLRLVIAQRLVRVLCPACSVPDHRQETIELLDRPLTTFMSDVKAPDIRRHSEDGCGKCRHTGYRGRTMVYELLRVNSAVRRMIEEGATTSAIHEKAVGTNKTMWARGLRFVAAGVTSIDELRRSVDEPGSGE